MTAIRSFRTFVFYGLSGLVELKILNCQIVYESVQVIGTDHHADCSQCLLLEPQVHPWGLNHHHLTNVPS